MRRRAVYRLTILLLLGVSVNPCFAAGRAPQEPLTPEKADPQFAALLDKQVVVKLKSGKSISGRLGWGIGGSIHFDGKAVTREKSIDAYFIRREDGIWRCGGCELISPTDVLSIREQKRFTQKAKAMGKASAVIALTPAIIVAAIFGYEGCR
jgi:hypothetical protein